MKYPLQIVTFEALESRQLLANGLTGQYFDNKDFTSPKLTRTDATVNFNWAKGSPASAIAADTFSVRWTGQLVPDKTQAYKFYTNSDDGVRLWINGKLVIDMLVTNPATTYTSSSINLTAGKAVDLRLDYFDNTGAASAKLYWSSTTLAKQIIPQKNLRTDASTTPTTPLPTRIDWNSIPNSPVLRAEANGATVNGKLYVLGGYVVKNGAIIAQTRCDVYDPKTNKWTQLGNMPVAFSHSGIAVDGSTIWLVGQYTGNHPGPGSTQVWKYNASNDSWSRGPDLPEPRGAGAAALLGRKLHFFGGMDKTRTIEQSEHWVLDLDKISAGWVEKAPMPNGRNHLAGVALNGYIYAIGGQHGQEGEQDAQSEVDRYDPVTDKWTKITSLPGVRSHLVESVFVMNGRIIVPGGEIGYQKQTNTVYAYDPVTNKWSLIGTLPIARSSSVAGVIGPNQIIIATGNGANATANAWIGTLS